MKRMQHPVHGWDHVYSPQEEAVMRANGWVDDKPAPEVVKAPEVVPEVFEPVPEFEPPKPPKPAVKKPHKWK